MELRFLLLFLTPTDDGEDDEHEDMVEATEPKERLRITALKRTFAINGCESVESFESSLSNVLLHCMIVSLDFCIKDYLVVDRSVS